MVAAPAPGRVRSRVVRPVGYLLPAITLMVLASAVRAAGGDSGLVGTDPGSEKERLDLQVQEQAAAPGTLAPAVGRPVEQWHPVITEGIDNNAVSPFEGSTFVLSNMWQSSLDSRGMVTRVWAGVDGPSSRLIIVTTELQTGIDVSRRVIELPANAGPPRITAASRGVLTVGSANGPVFALDVTAGSLVRR